MCNLSEALIERTAKENLEMGLEQGLEQGMIRLIQNYLSNGGTEDDAKRMLNVTDEQIALAKARMQTMCNLSEALIERTAKENLYNEYDIKLENARS